MEQSSNESSASNYLDIIVDEGQFLHYYNLTIIVFVQYIYIISMRSAINVDQSNFQMTPDSVHVAIQFIKLFSNQHSTTERRSYTSILRKLSKHLLHYIMINNYCI